MITKNRNQNRKRVMGNSSRGQGPSKDRPARPPGRRTSTRATRPPPHPHSKAEPSPGRSYLGVCRREIPLNAQSAAAQDGLESTLRCKVSGSMKQITFGRLAVPKNPFSSWFLAFLAPFKPFAGTLPPGTASTGCASVDHSPLRLDLFQTSE